MAGERILLAHQKPIEAATLLNPFTPIKLAGTSGLLALPVATSTDRPYGITGAGTIPANEIVAAFERGNEVKAIGGASAGAGQPLYVGSTNGVVVGGGASLFAASAHWEIGLSAMPVRAGERFTIIVDPRKV